MELEEQGQNPNWFEDGPSSVHELDFLTWLLQWQALHSVQ